jgi:hypothetical protein
MLPSHSLHEEQTEPTRFPSRGKPGQDCQHHLTSPMSASLCINMLQIPPFLAFIATRYIFCHQVFQWNVSRNKLSNF